MVQNFAIYKNTKTTWRLEKTTKHHQSTNRDQKRPEKITKPSQKTTKDHKRPDGTSLVFSGLIWSFLVSSGLFWSSHSGLFWSHLVSSGLVWSFCILSPLEKKVDQTRPDETRKGHHRPERPAGLIWCRLVFSGLFWSSHPDETR